MGSPAKKHPRSPSKLPTSAVGTKIRIWCVEKCRYRRANVVANFGSEQVLEYKDGQLEFIQLEKHLSICKFPSPSRSRESMVSSAASPFASPPSPAINHSASASTLLGGTRITVYWLEMKVSYKATVLASLENFHAIQYRCDKTVEWIDFVENDFRIVGYSPQGDRLLEKKDQAAVIPVGTRLAIWWPLSNAYFEASVTSHVSGDQYRVLFDEVTNDKKNPKNYECEPETLALSQFHFKILSVPLSMKKSLRVPQMLYQHASGSCPYLEPNTRISVWSTEMESFQEGMVVRSTFEDDRCEICFADSGGDTCTMDLSTAKIKILSTPSPSLRYRPMAWSLC